MEIIRILGLDSTAIDAYDISRVEEEVVRHLLHDVSLVSDDDSDSEVGSDDSEDTLILGEKKAGGAADAAAGEAGESMLHKSDDVLAAQEEPLAPLGDHDRKYANCTRSDLVAMLQDRDREVQMRDQRDTIKAKSNEARVRKWRRAHHRQDKKRQKICERLIEPVDLFAVKTLGKKKLTDASRMGIAVIRSCANTSGVCFGIANRIAISAQSIYRSEVLAGNALVAERSPRKI